MHPPLLAYLLGLTFQQKNMKKYQLTPEQKAERAERRKALAEKVRSMIEEKVTPPVSMNADGKPYSPFNQLMIYAQNGGRDGIYGGFATWLTKGRKVKKGAKGVMVYCPMSKKSKLEDEGTTEDDKKFGCFPKFVFHVEDTEEVAA
jgi:hypothetical protein